MSTPQPVEVPRVLATSYARSFGDEGSAWLAALPALVADLLDVGAAPAGKAYPAGGCRLG